MTKRQYARMVLQPSLLRHHCANANSTHPYISSPRSLFSFFISIISHLLRRNLGAGRGSNRDRLAPPLPPGSSAQQTYRASLSKKNRPVSPYQFADVAWRANLLFHLYATRKNTLHACTHNKRAFLRAARTRAAWTANNSNGMAHCAAHLCGLYAIAGHVSRHLCASLSATLACKRALLRGKGGAGRSRIAWQRATLKGRKRVTAPRLWRQHHRRTTR